MTESNETREVPLMALRFAGAEAKLGDNGAEAKTVPIEILARTGQPLQHWFWGKIVHDMSGLTLHKKRLALDWRHDDDVPMGYVSNFDTSSGDLVASGALIPFAEGDKVDEVIHKSKLGLPLEASIDWSAPCVLEDIPDGMSAEVNGYTFDGPGIIVRQWGLRGIALCLYGADQNTESRLSADQEKVTVNIKKFTKEQEMSEQSVEVAVATVETPEVAADEAAVVEAPAVEPVSAEVVEAVPPAAETPAVEAVVPAAVDEVTALRASAEQLSAEVEKLKADLAEARKLARGEEPVALPPERDVKTLAQMIKVRG